MHNRWGPLRLRCEITLHDGEHLGLLVYFHLHHAWRPFQNVANNFPSHRVSEVDPVKPSLLYITNKENALICLKKHRVIFQAKTDDDFVLSVDGIFSGPPGRPLHLCQPMEPPTHCPWLLLTSTLKGLCHGWVWSVGWLSRRQVQWRNNIEYRCNIDPDMVERQQKLSGILHPFEDVCSKKLGIAKGFMGRVYLLPGSQPKRTHSYCTVPDKRKVEQKANMTMVKNNVMVPAHSKWAASIVFSNKKYGTFQFCG